MQVLGQKGVPCPRQGYPLTSRAFMSMSVNPLKVILSFVARMVCRFPVVIIVVSVLITLISLWATFRFLKFKTSTSDLIQSDTYYQSLFLKYQNEFRKEEAFVIVVESNSDEQSRAVVDFLGTEIPARLTYTEKPVAQPTDTWSRIKSRLLRKSDDGPVTHSGLIYPDQRNFLFKLKFDTLKSRGLLYQSIEELGQFQKEIEGSRQFISSQGQKADLTSIIKTANQFLDERKLKQQGQFQEMKSFLPKFVGILNDTADVVDDPLRKKSGKETSEIKQTSFTSVTEEMEKKTYLSLSDDKTLLVTITPPPPVHGKTYTPYAEEINSLREILKLAESKFPGSKLGLTGEPVLNDDEMRSQNSDTTLAGVLTFVFVALLFMYAYKGIARPLLEVIALLVATVWAMGFTAITVGHLNILSQVFAIMIIGLGDDFAIHLITRLEEERKKGKSSVEAMFIAITDTGEGVCVGALAIAIAFFTMCFTGFRGLEEMGFIAGFGLLICLVCCLTFLPAMLIIQERRGKNRGASSKHYVTPFLAKVEEKMLARPLWVVLIVLALTGAALWRAGSVPFDYNLLELQSPKLESVQYAKKLNVLHPIQFAAITVNSVEEVRKTTATLSAAGLSNVVLEVQSLAPLIPIDQESKLKIIRDMQKMLGTGKYKTAAPVDWANLKPQLIELRAKAERFERLSKQFGYKEESAAFAQFIPPIDRLLNSAQNYSQKELEERLTAYQRNLFKNLQSNFQFILEHKIDRPVNEDDIPPALKEKFKGKTGKYLIEVYPREDVWNRPAMERFVNAVRTVDKEATGTPIQNFEFIDLLRDSYAKAAIYGFCFIFIIMVFYFKRPLPILLSIIPLGVGIVWALFIMWLTDLRLNPANIMVLPLIIGIGMDNGIHIVHRFQEEHEIGLFKFNTGRAILVSNLTTIGGFLSLVVAQHRGIASLGLVMAVGIACCMVVSFTLLPALMQLCRKQGWKI